MSLGTAADALLQQKAIQTSHHERLESECNRLHRSVRHVYMQLRDSVVTVKRLEEDLQDLQQETRHLDEQLEHHYPLRLAMLQVIRTKSQEHGDATVKRLENAPLCWSGVPQRLIKTAAELEEYIVTITATNDAVQSCSAATSLYARLCSTVRLQFHVGAARETDQRIRCGPVVQLAAALQEINARCAETAKARVAAVEQHVSSQEVLRARRAAEESVRSTLEECRVASAEQEQQLTEAQATSEELRAQCASLANAQNEVNALRDVKEASISLLHVFATGIASLFKEAVDGLALTADALSQSLVVRREANGAVQRQNEGQKELLAALRTQEASLREDLRDHVVVASGISRVLGNELERIASARAAHDESTRALVTLDHQIASVLAAAEAARAQREVRLRELQADLTRLLMDDMPSARGAIELDEHAARATIAELQVSDMSTAIEHAAQSQMMDALRRQRPQAPPQQQQQASQVVAETPEPRRTVAHKPPVPAATTLVSAAASDKAYLRAPNTAGGGTADPSSTRHAAISRHRLQVLQRGRQPPSPCMSTWSANERADAQRQTHNGAAIVRNGGATGGASRNPSPSPQPRPPSGLTGGRAAMGVPQHRQQAHTAASRELTGVARRPAQTPSSAAAASQQVLGKVAARSFAPQEGNRARLGRAAFGSTLQQDEDAFDVFAL